MGLLDQVMKNTPSKDGICETCKNLIQVSDNALGCTAHDKLIMPDFPPYHGRKKCADWVKY